MQSCGKLSRAEAGRWVSFRSGGGGPVESESLLNKEPMLGVKAATGWRSKEARGRFDAACHLAPCPRPGTEEGAPSPRPEHPHSKS